MEERGTVNYREAASILADWSEAVGGKEGTKIARNHAAYLAKKNPNLKMLKSSLKKASAFGLDSTLNRSPTESLRTHLLRRVRRRIGCWHLINSDGSLRSKTAEQTNLGLNQGKHCFCESSPSGNAPDDVFARGESGPNYLSVALAGTLSAT